MIPLSSIPTIIISFCTIIAALGLPPAAISYEGVGATQPLASNDDETGRALNRRVEVEVWYDEVRQKATLEEVVVQHEVKTVKVCRMETVCKLRYVEGHARRARVQNLIAPLYFESEAIDVPEQFVEQVEEGRDHGEQDGEQGQPPQQEEQRGHHGQGRNQDAGPDDAALLRHKARRYRCAAIPGKDPRRNGRNPRLEPVCR